MACGGCGRNKKMEAQQATDTQVVAESARRSQLRELRAKEKARENAKK